MKNFNFYIGGGNVSAIYNASENCIEIECWKTETSMIISQLTLWDYTIETTVIGSVEPVETQNEKEIKTIQKISILAGGYVELFNGKEYVTLAYDGVDLHVSWRFEPETPPYHEEIFNVKSVGFYLTNGGNVLSVTPYNAAFFKPTGELIRAVNHAEVEWLYSSMEDNRIELSEKLEEKFTIPEWKFEFEVSVSDDYSNWKAETCNNGGNYSFHTYRKFYTTESGGKRIVRYVDYCDTSAGFDYCNLGGNFTDTVSCEAKNGNLGLSVSSSNKFQFIEDVSKTCTEKDASEMMYSIRNEENEVTTKQLLTQEQLDMLFPVSTVRR